MKNKPLHIALILGVLLPCIMLLAVSRMYAEGERGPTEENPEEKSLQVLMPDGAVCEMALENYVLGVVLGEMPASFETEALKAQAVVARTYALREKRHQNADICTDHTCCQAYCAPEAYTGGKNALKKVRSAVLATAGEVVTYQGNLIEATYFSCSGGRTEDAVAVWGTDYPYLQAVDSPGEEQAAYYTDIQIFSASEFARLLQLPLTGDPESWIGTATYTEGGGIHTLTIGGKSFTGTELRSLLGLKSTAFSVAVEDSQILITTRGYGHRVGMSQYGADAMAALGSSWEEILAHYYRGTELTTLS